MKKPKQTPTKSPTQVRPAGSWAKTEAPIHNSTTMTLYTAPELHPFEGRPGSLDFLDCPSRVGSRLTYRGDAS